MNKRYYNEGHEQGVYWYLNWKGDNMIIHAEDEDDFINCIQEIHIFQYKPVFGFDACDVEAINTKLDECIKTIIRGKKNDRKA